MLTTINFGFLRGHDLRLATLGGQAEQYFRDDPTTTIGKLRQFAELLAKLIAAHHAQYRGERETFDETLRRLSDERIIPRETANVFHALRKLGNDAVHEAKGNHADALRSLKFARQLGIWFHRTYGRHQNFNPGPFVPPSKTSDATEALKEEVAALQRKIAELTEAAAGAKRQAEELSFAREILEERLQREAEERATWEQLARESEAARLELTSRVATRGASPGGGMFGKRTSGSVSVSCVASVSSLPSRSALAAALPDHAIAALQAAAQAASKEQMVEFLQRGEQAATEINLDDAGTPLTFAFDEDDSGRLIPKKQNVPEAFGRRRGMSPLLTFWRR
jgi:type I restriction enzyme R subunit